MHDMTEEDMAALGHFVRRWTRAQPLNHAQVIAQPEALDYRAMFAREVASERVWRIDCGSLARRAATGCRPASWAYTERVET